MIRVLTHSILVLLSCAATTIAADSRGYWTGPLTTPAGSLQIGLFLGGDAATPTALLDAPALGLVDAPLGVTMSKDRVLLELATDGGVATGDVVLAADELIGSVTIGTATYPIAFRRGTRPEKSYRTQDVTLRNGDVTLAAILYLPKGSGRVPAIAFVAGLVARNNAVHFLADLFANCGIAVITYDRRGLGKSTGNRRASFGEHAADATAAVAYLRSRAEIDPARIGIRGQSQGAWLAPLVAASVPVAFVVATGGGGVQPWQSETYAIPARLRADGFTPQEIAEATRYMEKLFEVARSGKGWDDLSAMMTKLREDKSRWFGKYGPVPQSLESLRQTWHGEFSYDPEPALKALKVPFLALSGDQDVYSPSAETLRVLSRVVTASDKTVKIIPGATHDFHVPGAPLPLVSREYLTTIVDWTTAHAGVASLRRSVAGNRILSTEPKVTIAPDSSMRYVGSFTMDIRNAARAERFIFADADPAGNVRRLFIAQFESMLPQHQGSYDSKPTTPVRLGPFVFQQVVGRYSFIAASAAKPGAEAERTKSFLEERGLRVDTDLLVARFETLTDASRRSELILFYWEDFASLGLTRNALDAMSDPERSQRFADFAERAKAQVTVDAQ